MTCQKCHKAAGVMLLVFTMGQTAIADAREFDFEKGDRVVFIGNTFADQLRLHGYLETLLTTRHPEHKLRFRILGWSGDTLTVRPRPLNFGGLDEHLGQQKASVIIACFGMNESYDGPDGVDAFRADWRAFVEHVRSQRYDGKSPPRLIMVSPIYHEPTPRIGDAQQHNANLRRYVAVMDDVARETATPFVDLYSVTEALAKESPSQRLTKNGIHLNLYGYWAVGQLFDNTLASDAVSWRVEIDAKRPSLTHATGTEVSGLEVSEQGLAFSVSDRQLPSPIPPAGAVVHSSLIARQPTLTVKNLKAGSYRLLIDNEVVATAGHDQWAVGVVLTTTPSHQAVETLRQAIVEKNANFFYRWRPANAEYVFGRRAKPYGVVSFPPEMETFDSMLETADRAIWSRSKPLADQKWRIERSD